MLINKKNITNLGNGFKGSFRRGLSSRQNATWRRIATRINSMSKAEFYNWLGQFPKLRKWVGERVIKAMAAHEYSVINDKYEATIEVDREDIEDDTLGLYGPLFEEAGISAGEFPDDLVYEALLAGFTELAYDQEFFFDTDHPEGAGVASNYQAGAGSPWFLLDTSRALKPLIFQDRIKPEFQAQDDPSDPNVVMRDKFIYGIRARGAAGYFLWQLAYASEATLNESNFDDAVAAMMSRENDEGQNLGVRPDLLVVGPENRAAAKALIETERLTSGATNKNFRAVDVLVVPRLAGA